MLAIHREMLERVIYTPKGQWFQNPEYGLDYNLLYGEPTHSDITEEVKRCMLELPAVLEVLSVYSVLIPPKKKSDTANLSIVVNLILDNEKESEMSFTLPLGVS